MTEAELAVVTILASSVGGALGARNAEAQAWKGLVIIAVSSIVTVVVMLLLLNVENGVLTILVNLIVAGVVGAILKMSPRQTSIVINGAILATVIAAVLISFVS
ncbi:hypothetical protein Rleg4DRAFT_1887 [Rhizobium leguminosarum bv. trifolii WSM2297]|uniref:Transmembrane protein n=1 Tax=Rhizobium leguminosarum bv. trifolii WSM2297 TaxID=754762 RepID=J0W3I3_RHILT|nr:hypothetical protein [Rhizobium leguminosarum]EJC80266.1 hypothetical protein Rleg4DRAFT_1887 [Rhizobium leguminosarum bv. trifolii WSM2297]